MSVLAIAALMAGIFCAVMLALALLPRLIAHATDPPRMRRIESVFAAAGCTGITVTPHPSHYRVDYTHQGVSHSAKCRIDMQTGRMTWIGGAPAWA